MTTPDPLDSLLSTIAELEDHDEPDLFPWHDAARWSPGVVSWDDPYGDVLVFEDDGCVMRVDAARPWVVLEYAPPWWAE